MVTLFGLPISFITVIYPALQDQYKLPKLIEITSYDKWFLIIAGWYALTLIFIVILLADGSHRYAKSVVGEKEEENKILQQQNQINQTELIKMRQELRNREDSKVVDIPKTLGLITDWYKETAKEKQKIKVSQKIYNKVLIELLDLNNITDIVKPKKMSREVVSTISKRVKKRMGYGKKNLDIEWAKRLYAVMDENNVGLERAQDSSYLKLENKLKNQTSNISETKLYHVIWEYVDSTYAGYSLEVFVKFGDLKTAIEYLPYDVKMVLRQMDEKLARATGSGIAQVNHILEKYRGGEEIK